MIDKQRSTLPGLVGIFNSLLQGFGREEFLLSILEGIRAKREPTAVTDTVLVNLEAVYRRESIFYGLPTVREHTGCAESGGSFFDVSFIGRISSTASETQDRIAEVGRIFD